MRPQGGCFWDRSWRVRVSGALEGWEAGEGPPRPLSWAPPPHPHPGPCCSSWPLAQHEHLPRLKVAEGQVGSDPDWAWE